jgi:Ca2+-transporting ATPase
MIVVLYVPVFAELFDTIPLGLDGWMVVLPCSLIPLVLGELYKVIRYRGK